MNVPKSDVKYLLAEFSELNFQINNILKSTSRIKYTCFDVSQQFIIFGSTSGGLYVFNRSPCRFLQLIPNQTGPVTHLSISHNEDWIAFSSKNGLVYVVRRRSNILPVIPETQISYEHEGNGITSLKWDFQNTQLFIGDDTGRVSVLNLHYIIGKKILHSTSFLLLELKSPIVQLDTSEELLLVSSITKTVLCNTQRQIFQQVGLRARYGKFGACFMSSKALGSIYCARPGHRLWEVDLNGNVICTHKFRDLSVSPMRVVNAVVDNSNSSIDAVPTDTRKQNKNFNKLFAISNKLILTYSSDIIQIINPSSCEITLRTEDYSNIASCRILNNILYVFTKNGSVHEIHLMTIEELIVKCYYLQHYCLSSSLSHEHEQYLIQRIKQEASISKIHSFENYHFKSNMTSILRKLLNYDFQDLFKDDTLDDEILFKRDRRKQVKQEEELNKNDFNLNKDTIINLENNIYENDMKTKIVMEKALPDIETNMASNEENMTEVETTVGNDSVIIITEVQEEQIDDMNKNIEIQEIKEKFDTILTVNVQTNIIQTENEIENTPILQEDEVMKINEPLLDDFAGQGQFLSSVALANRDINEETNDKIEKCVTNNIEKDNKEDGLDNDLEFIHLGEELNEMRVDFGPESNIPDSSVMKLLHSVIKETRERQCTVPEKLPILTEYDSFGIVNIFKNLHNYILQEEGGQYEQIDYECSKLFLQFVTLRLDMLDSIENFKDHLIHCVVTVESNRSKTCVCGYPMPHQILRPLFYGLCKKVYNLLSDDLNKRVDLCGKIPYLWHLIIDNEKDPSVNILSLIMQLDYQKGFDALSKSFSEEDYMNVIDYKITLNSKRCLLCFSKLEYDLFTDELTSYNISWNYVGNCMYRAFGGTKTLNMLISKSNEIPKGSIDLEFYHFLMLNP